MKKLTICTLIVAMLLLTSALAAGELTIITPNKINFGDSGQARSNPEAGKEKYYNIYTKEETFTVKNTGNETLTNIKIESTLGSQYNLTLNDNNEFELIPNATKIISAKVRVPKDFDAVIEGNLEENIAEIGTINVVSGTISASVIATLQTANKLEIDDIEICITGITDDCESVNNDDRIDGIKPGSKVSVEVIVKNKYKDNSDKEDLEMDDVFVEIEISDSDVNENDEDDIENLNPRDTDSVTLDIEFDDDVDAKKYKLEITVWGIDENGARHGEKWIVELEVERNRHDVLINKLDIEPQTLSCLVPQSSASLDLNIHNYGRNDEDEVTVEFEVEQFGIKDKKEDIKLDKNDDKKIRFIIPIPPKVKAGTYAVEINTYYDKDQFSDSVSTTLTVPSCEEAVQDDTTTSNVDDVVVTPPIVVTPTPVVAPTTPTPTTTTEDFEFTNSTAYVVILVVLVIFALSITGLLVRKILKD